MIRSTPELARLERRYAREREKTDSYAQSLAVFTALWVEAVALSEGFPGDWEEDIQPDIAVARALNDLPPDA